MVPDIMDKFAINDVIFGQFAGIYYIGYILSHIPLGIMIDSYGVKKILIPCILCIIIGMLPMILTDQWVYLFIGRLLVGAGSSAAILGAFKVIRMAFAEDRFSFMLGLTISTGLLGAIYGGGALNYLYQQIGYEKLIQLCIIVGFILLGAVCWVIPHTADEDTEVPILKRIKLVLSNVKFLLLCLLSGLMVGPLEGFADVWGITFFNQAYGLSNASSSTLVSWIFLGMCLGGPLLTLIAARTSYLGTILAAAIAMFLIFIIFATQIFGLVGLTILCFMLGICCYYQTISIYQASTYSPVYAISLANAVTNMIIMSFGYFFHSSIGIVSHISSVQSATINVIAGALLLSIMGLSIFIHYTKRYKH